MLNLGKVVHNKSRVVDIYTFNMENMTWSSKGYDKCTWVVKRYFPGMLQCINDLDQTVEEHTKKNVQMQYLASNITKTLGARVTDVCNDEFGQTFAYTEIFMGKFEDQEEYFTLEKFIDGTFTKYINNTGEVCTEGGRGEIREKAECLSHYSYEKSSQQLMLLDIQGSEYTLYDPEIASASLQANEEFLFGAGNLTIKAIKSFAQNHKCNEFCKYVGLKPMPVLSDLSEENN
jgi:hypothetical protein